MAIYPPDGISEDWLLGRRVRLRQPTTGYRAAIDPVLLAAAIAPEHGRRILDLGCGVGAAALCLVARCPEILVTGWELQPALARLAMENAELNQVADRFLPEERDALAKSNGEALFDQVISNPPYHGAGTPAATESESLATREVDLAGWVKAAARALKPRGHLTLIYRADRLTTVLAALERGFGGVLVAPIWPREGAPAKRILVRATKGSRAALTLAPGLILHAGATGFTAQAEAILRDAAPLPL